MRSLTRTPPAAVAGLGAWLAYGTTLWLVAVHVAEASHERHEPSLVVHVLRDGTLALPGVLAAVWLVIALVERLQARRPLAPCRRAAVVAARDRLRQRGRDGRRQPAARPAPRHERDGRPAGRPAPGPRRARRARCRAAAGGDLVAVGAAQQHAFAIDGVVHETFGPAGSPTATKDVAFPAPAPGTYIYHDPTDAPVNRVLGLHGVLGRWSSTAHGPWHAFIDDPVGYDRACETLLVPYAVDPRWHSLEHAAGLRGEDLGLNRFEPTSFYLLGGDLDAAGKRPARNAPDVPICGRILARAPGEQPGLLRILDSKYFPTVVRFGLAQATRSR
jgi:hypothetical protein